MTREGESGIFLTVTGEMILKEGDDIVRTDDDAIKLVKEV